ncbi:ABC transporter substrate-binding protein [Cohnella hashimotonis]|uniref:ABC transporter substrate-binding protein n=1 Tax=Cohnella hashimotonis TaxID=2826895 RepID=A0ABT6TTL9_9BACL|nr:ABC transporter substrate-binding protein [Cohnella hashimotonis]MDI4649523.1 ABC transporter substrate-binding protein [Cohnella hashimotonis]
MRTMHKPNVLTRKLWKPLFAAMTAAILLMLAACGGNDNAGSGGAVSSGSGGSAKAQTLIIGMSAANLPVPDTYPTEGYEGFRFVGFQIYDALVNWDLSKGDAPAALKPGLAESWETSDSDNTMWTFHLRQGVTFTDGTPFNADAVIFALDRIHNKDSEFYDAQLAGNSASGLRYVASYAKVDDHTITIKTTVPYSFLPYDLTNILIGSPEAIKTSGKNFAPQPVGTGPFKFVSMKQGQEMVLAKNESYWGGAPKLDKIVLRPISDPSARLAAIQSGEVDWAEVPPTESIELLKSAGYQILTNPYPHIWPYVLNVQDGPWKDVRVRQAANYAIDREGMSTALLGGAAKPATQPMYEGHAWYNDAAEPYSYDPEKAKQLLAEAGYPNGFQTTFIVPTSGSGNMWPIQMNEYVQKNLKAVGIDVKIESIEWQSLLTSYIQGFPKDKEVGAYNISLPTISPSFYATFFATSAIFPNGINIGGYSNPDYDALLDKAMAEFDKTKQDEYLKQASKILADDAPWIYVVHDLNLRALAPKVKGFVQPQSWFADLTTISIE